MTPDPPPETDDAKMEMCPTCWGECEIEDVTQPGMFAVCRMCGGEGLVPVPEGEEVPRGDYALPYWRWDSDVLVGEWIQ